MNTFNTEQYKCLELIVRTNIDTNGYICLKQDDRIITEQHIDVHTKKWLKFPVEMNTEYELICRDIEPGVIYLSGCEHIFESGVRYLELQAGRISEVVISEHYDTPYRDRFHFMPYRNWINDPNGLCWYQGYYHYFYQANPFSQEWDDIYWGHAVSKDMVRWTHLPYVLEPQQEITADPKYSGGAFSGCAYPTEKEVYFFLTRHIQERDNDDTIKEWQTMMKSSDMIHFTEEQVIIEGPPDGAGHDFRDPKVSKLGDTYYMVLASNIDGAMAMLLYSSKDLHNWDYEKPLITDREEGATTYECPDFFSLDGKFLAMAALMRHHDEYNRYQMSRYYVGDFKNNDFQIEQTGWVDFGGDFYAAQTFEHEGQRIIIGWVSDFHNEHREEPGGCRGGFAIPRVMHIKDNLLYMEPVPQIYDLKGENLYSLQREQKHIMCEQIKENAYYVEADFRGKTDFNILLGKRGNSQIRLLYKDNVLEIKTTGVRSEQVRFPVQVETLEHLEIFVDRRTVEVYANHGYAAGTKVFYNDNETGIFEAEFENEKMLSMIELHQMESIWK